MLFQSFSQELEHKLLLGNACVSLATHRKLSHLSQNSKPQSRSKVHSGSERYMVILRLFFDSYPHSALSANQVSSGYFFVGQVKTGASEITY